MRGCESRETAEVVRNPCDLSRRLRAIQWSLLVLFGITSILLAAGGYWYWCHEVQAIRSEKYNELDAIAGLKVTQLVQWRKARMGDARVNSKGAFLRSAIGRGLQASGNTSLRTEVQKNMELIRESYGYADVVLTGTDGTVLLSLNPHLTALDANAKRLVAQAVSSQDVVFGDFFRCPTCNRVHLDVAASILDADNRSVAVLILRTDPEQYLYPLIQSWPTPSSSAETLLIRRDGDDVLFLNRLRHTLDPALTLRIPLSHSDVPAARAALGQTGECEGGDYRSVDVLADIRSVPDSPWFMVAKVDADEILAEARYRGGVALLFVVLSIVMTGGMAVFVFNYWERHLYRNLYRAERERREAQEEIRTTLYSIGDAVIATDAEGCVTRMNRVAERLTGWSEATALGRPLDQVFHIVSEETHVEIESPVARVISEGIIVGLANHTLLIARDGTECPIADSGAPIRNKEGRITGVVLVFRDQTEERRQQAALRESEERFRLLVEGVREYAIFMLDPRGNVASWNEGAERIKGYAKEEIIGQHFSVFYPEDDRLGGKPARVLEIAAVEGRFEEEGLRRRKDGAHFSAHILITAVRDEGGTLRGFSKVTRDITDRKQAEQALRESHELYRTTLYSIGDAVIATDARGRVLQMNAVAEMLTGWRESEALDKPLEQVFCILNEESRAAVENPVARVIREGAVVGLANHTALIAKDGTERPIADSGAPMRDKEGEITGVVLVFRDQSEQRRADRALRSSEARYRSLFDNMTEGFALHEIVTDAEGHPSDYRFLDVNPAFERLTGLKRTDLVGRRVLEVLPGTEPHWIENYGRVALSGEPTHFENYSTELGRWCEVLAYQPAPRQFAVIVTDITEHKRASERIQHGNALLKGMNRILREALSGGTEEEVGRTCLAVAENVTQSKFGFLGEINPEGRMDSIAISDPGWDACRMDTATGHRIVHQGFEIRGLYRRVLRDGEGFFTNEPASHPDSIGTPEGHPPLEAFVGVPLIHGGKTIGMVAVANREGGYRTEDLEALEGLSVPIVQVLLHKRAGDALRTSEERLRTAIETLPDAIVLVEVDGNVLMANQQAALLGGFRDVGELFASGKGGFDFLTPEDRQRAQAQMGELLEKGVVRNREVRVCRTDGGHTSVEINASLQRDAHGEPKAMLVVVRDISDRKRTEDSLRRATQAAEAANRAKSEFLANMSHEIRTPMTAILGLSDLLMTPNLPYQEQREFLTGIQRNGRALMDLISDILDLSRIEADRLTLETVPYPLRRVIDDVLPVVQVRAEQKGLSLGVDYTFPLPETIHTDPVRLRQILTNLIGNAVKFTEHGAVRIAVRCNREADGPVRVQFAIADTGIGIPADKIGELFQPFTQVDASSTRRYGGTGLGLAISKRLAKALGGDVEVASEFGKGSTFTLTIDAGSLEGVRMLDSPLPVEPAAEEPSAKEESLVLRGRVLLAEDVPAVSSVINHILKRMGLEVEIAEDGGAVCEMAEKSRAAGRPLDLILMDIQMPKLNGYEATRWLRQHGWRGPIVAVTAHALVGDREKCLDAGCDDYIAKPFTATGLQAILARYLAKAVPPAGQNTSTQGAETQPAGLLEGGFLDAAKAAELVGLFVAELPARAEAIEEALTSRDLNSLVELAHQLKGTAGIYGFTAIADAARLVHQEAKEEKEWEQLHATVAELVKQCKHASSQGPIAS